MSKFKQLRADFVSVCEEFRDKLKDVQKATEGEVIKAIKKIFTETENAEIWPDYCSQRSWLLEQIDKTYKELYEKSVQKVVREYLDSEEFIDRLVKRINRKQLKP